VGSHETPPDFADVTAAKGKKPSPAPETPGVRQAVKAIPAGGVASVPFRLELPASAFLDGNYVWVRARVDDGRGKPVVLDRAVSLSR
jgi:hypothetical protein